MKLLNPVTLFFKNLKGRKVNSEPDYLRQIYWERECKDHPTRKHCLIYCE